MKRKPSRDVRPTGDDMSIESGQRRLKSSSDRLLLDCADELIGPDVLVVLTHGTTLASALREARPDLRFTFYTPEHFFFRTLQQYHTEIESGGAFREKSHRRLNTHTQTPVLVCEADLPDGCFDEALFSTSSGDSSDVAQELFQSLHQRLRSGGRLFASTNNPKDRWVQSQLRLLYPQVDVRKSRHGVVCVAERTAPLKKLRGFRARFDFRLGERILTCETRPGVFSHRRLDGGARALIKSLHLVSNSGEVPEKILEMGCGCGAVSLAAAATFPEAEVLAVDSDARAIECTRKSADLNQMSRIATLLTSDGVVPEAGSWDLILGNPPYYSDFRIAELFLQAGRRGLRAGGRIHVVTKPVEWQEARMKQLFAEVQGHKIGDYVVFTARQRG